MKDITETFGYDSQNRLTGVWIGAPQAISYTGCALTFYSLTLHQTTIKIH
ncbi:MAG: hypothetical protein II887_08580 [Bacteroidales bacterium]|nr:hypothetical protein [Bacteroidales bacterium]